MVAPSVSDCRRFYCSLVIGGVWVLYAVPDKQRKRDRKTKENQASASEPEFKIARTADSAHVVVPQFISELSDLFFQFRVGTLQTSELVV
jgi:hypothetical protein